MLRQDVGTVDVGQQQGEGLGQLQGDHIAINGHTGQAVCFTILQSLITLYILESLGAAGVGVCNVVFDSESYVLSIQGLTIMPLYIFTDGQSELSVIIVVAPLGSDSRYQSAVGTIPVHQGVKYHVRIQALHILSGRLKQGIDTDRLAPLQLQGSLTLRHLSLLSLILTSNSLSCIGRGLIVGFTGLLVATACQGTQQHSKCQQHCDQLFHCLVSSLDNILKSS